MLRRRCILTPVTRPVPEGEIPEDVVRRAWLAGTEAFRATVPEDDPVRKTWSAPEDLWRARSHAFSQGIRAAVRVVDRWRARRPGGKAR